MLLLIRVPEQQKQSALSYLHSTMLLLILAMRSFTPISLPNLHSTMLLLIPASPFPIFFTWLSFTFHYASTYTGYCRGAQTEKFHLHSTMLLLILSTLLKFYSAISNLHSTMLLLIRRERSCKVCSSSIYIPLCFYLYPSIRSCRPSWNSFTFHYASTYTQTPGLPCSACPAFTFHYASTYTGLLLLLSAWPFLIYIPLCFYLYVVESICLPTSFAYLHSTMLLLIR